MIAGAGVIAGALASRAGLLRTFHKGLARSMANVGSGPTSAALRGAQNWAHRSDLPELMSLNVAKQLWNNPSVTLGQQRKAIAQWGKTLSEEIAKAKKLGGSSAESFKFTDLGRALAQRGRVVDDAKARWIRSHPELRGTSSVLDELHRTFDNALSGSLRVTPERQAHLMRTRGYRHATARDVLRQLPKGHRRLIHEAHTRDSSGGWLDRIVDRSLYIDDQKNIINMWGARSTALRAVEVAEKGIGLPLVGFNPLSMLYTSDVLKLRRPPVFYSFAKNTRQPYASGSTAEAEHLVFAGGKVFDLSNIGVKEVASDGYLLSTNSFLVNQHLRSMAGIPLAHYQFPKLENTGTYVKVMRALGLGFQDRGVKTIDDMALASAEAPLAKLAGQFWNFARPYESVTEIAARDAFGIGERWVFLNKTKPKELHRQLTAGRHRMQDVSTVTLPWYMLFSRLNVGVSQVGLGLPIEDLGSAASTFGNLLLKRFLPVAGGIEGYRYLNYEAENLTGFRPEEVVAEGFVENTKAIARLRDRSGATKRAKRRAELMPGLDQISELPVLGGMVARQSMTEEELAHYWEHGEDPVRKGRWWPLGNTPFTGKRVMYDQPNWYRRMRSKWQYTDTLYGDEDEYYRNAPYPTPRYPLCVLPGQLIVLSDSIVPIENVPNEATTFNNEGLQTEVVATLNRFANEAANEIIVKGKPAFPLRVTADHPVYIVRPSEVLETIPHRPHLNGRNVSRWIRTLTEQELLSCVQWIPAKDVQKDDLIISPRLTFGSLIAVDLAPIRSWAAVTNNWVYSYMPQVTAEAVELFETGGIPVETGNRRKDSRARERARRRLRNESLSRYPRYVPLSEDLATIIGVYIAEGHRSQSSGSGSTLNFTLNTNEIWLAKKLEDAAKNLAGSETTTVIEQRDSSNALRVLIHASWLADAMVAWCGKGAEQKHLPQWIFEAPESFVRTVLSFYIEGDGWDTEGASDSKKAKTVSKALAAQLIVVAEALGLAPSVKMTKSHETMIMGRKCIAKDAYTVSFPADCRRSAIICDHFILRQVVSNKQFHYIGSVYDLEVKEGASFTTITGIVHNSPIRHFITDPYHHEKTHYHNRPYLLTGGHPELEEFPLIGPLLAQAGELIKPTRRMHPEVWDWIEAGVVPQPGGAPAQIIPTQVRYRDGYELNVPNAIQIQASTLPDDPGLPSQWGTHKIGTPFAWGEMAEARARAVVVAVLDTGIDARHEDLAGQVLPGYNVFTNQADPWDDTGHGTHVAGIIGAIGNNRTGIAGTAYPAVKILPVKVLQNGAGNVESIAGGIDWATEWRGPHGEQVSVINMSFGSSTPHPGSLLYGAAVKRANEAGILVVAAAGNEGQEQSGVPALYPEALSVGATGLSPIKRDGLSLAPFSNRGIGVDITAPGMNIVSTMPGDSYASLSGTSIATPYVAGSAAILKSIRPDLTPEEMRYVLQGTTSDLGRTGTDSTYGSGHLDVGLAANLVANMTPEQRESLRRAGVNEKSNIATERQALLNYIRVVFARPMVEGMNSLIVDENGNPVTDPTTFRSRLIQTGENIREFAGLYGFMPDVVNTFDYRHTPKIATSRNITSYRRRWWDTETGGLGDSANEIARRFIGKKEYWPKMYNPVPNTMPLWLPGDDYISDFQHGDPYTRIPRGEIRLPGAAFEALYPDAVSEELKAHPYYPLIQKHRPDLIWEHAYTPMAKFRILASAAPWSDEYKYQSKQMTAMDLSPEERHEVQEIRARVSRRKEPVRLYPYRFRNLDPASEQVTVTRVVDANNFFTEEYPDNPIRLAAAYTSTAEGNETAEQADAYMRKVLRPGTKVDIHYDRDRMIADDTYQTIRAMVEVKGSNLNQLMINRGWAKENKDDFSTVGVLARFTPSEIRTGSLWERFAHLDTPIHTKFLQVRSPYESWHRREMYGKDFQVWDDPISNFIVPTYQSLIMHNPLAATAIGAAFGSLWGRGRFKVFTAAIGAIGVGGGSAWRSMYEATSGQAWIPPRRRKQWDTEEYFDILKYIKSARLFQSEVQAARDQENFDVIRYLTFQQDDRGARKDRIKALGDIKRQIYKSEHPDADAIALEYGFTIPELQPDEEGLVAEDSPEKRLRRLLGLINAELNTLRVAPPEYVLPPRATRALRYYEQMQQTMYGYQPGDPLQNILVALPKKERQYFSDLMQAPEWEREKIARIVPPFMLRGLAAMWGEEGPNQPDLQQYFSNRYLPGPDWAGWRPDVDLEDVKVKFVRHEGMDPYEFDQWPEDQSRAALEETDAPRAFNPKERGNALKRKLQDVLSGMGMQDIFIETIPTAGGIEIDMDIDQDRNGEIVDFVNQNVWELLS